MTDNKDYSVGYSLYLSFSPIPLNFTSTVFCFIIFTIIYKYKGLR